MDNRVSLDDPNYTGQETVKNNKSTVVIILVAIVCIALVFLYFNNNANKLDGVYRSSTGLYYSFAKHGGFALGFIGGTEMRIGGTGRYELNGNQLTIYIEYSGNTGTETQVCFYDKSSDTITNPAGTVFWRYK